MANSKVVIACISKKKVHDGCGRIRRRMRDKRIAHCYKYQTPYKLLMAVGYIYFLRHPL